MSAETRAGALSGIRVLELSTSYAAYAGRLLADLGADVVRVERPAGDPLRRAAPLDLTGDDTGSFAHAFLNANKKSVTLDLGSADGRALFARLAAKSDIVIETLAPGTLAELGIGYDAMRARNPAVILVSITAFGQGGPWANRRMTDLTTLAAGGLLSLGGYEDAGPVAVLGEQSCYAAGIFGAVGAMAALLQRLGTDRGQWIDVSAQECMAFALEDAIPEWYINHNVRKRSGDRAREAGTGVYPCQDGYISMVAGRLGTAKAFTALTRWIAEAGLPGSEDLLDPKWEDFRYRQSAEGVSRFSELFSAFCSTRSKESLYQEGQARQIAIAPVNSVADVLRDRQLLATGFFRSLIDPETGRPVTFPGPPYRLGETPAELRSTAPARGRHNREIFLGELGLSEADLTALVTSGAI